MAKRTGVEIKDLTVLEQLKLYGRDEQVVEAVNILLAVTANTGLDPEAVAEYLRGLLLSGENEIGGDENEVDEAETFVGLAVMERLLEMMPKSNEVWVCVSDLVKVVCGMGGRDDDDMEEVEEWVKDVVGKSNTTLIVEGGWIRMDQDAASRLHDEEDGVSYSDVGKQVRDLSIGSFAKLLDELPGYTPPRAHRGVGVHGS